MKKNFKIASVAFLAVGILSLNACKKDGDETAPVITINGNAAVEVSLQESYNDLGAIATDNEDEVVEVETSGTVNTNQKGEYIITYTATDAAGNVATEERVVTVVNDADYLAGTYTTTEGAGTPWTQTVTASETINNRVVFSKFANYSNNSAVYAEVIGSSIELPSAQNASGIGSSGCTHTFAPNGSSIIAEIAGKQTFSIKFTDQQIAGGSGCSATGAVAYTDAFVQQ